MKNSGINFNWHSATGCSTKCVGEDTKNSRILECILIGIVSWDEYVNT